MNRIQGKRSREGRDYKSHATHPQAPQVASASLTMIDGATPHSVFVPLHYEPNYKYPLVVWLHGPESNEAQLKRIMPLISMRNYTAVAPRSPAGPATWTLDEPWATAAEQAVFSAIEETQERVNVEPRRIFVAGFDAGGTMALRLAFLYPERFAGVISLGGHFPTGRATLARLTAARKLAVLLASGRQSQEYPEHQLCADLRLLHCAGITVTLRQYPGGHELSPQQLADVDRWVMDEVLRSKQLATEAAVH